jgi:hypothetical protein
VLLAEAAAIAQQLHAFNLFSANEHVSLPQSVRMVLGHDTATLARMRDQSMWCEAVLSYVPTLRQT